MLNQVGLKAALVAGMMWLLAACAAPDSAAVPASPDAAAAVPERSTMSVATPPAQPSAPARTDAPPQTQTSDAGNVVVTVTPQVLAAGAPPAFDIAMNTHSVDLAGDMLALVELRDERGNVQMPSAWDGPAGAGHHRSGTIRFDALPPGTRSVTLVVKNIAGIRERTFTWDVAS